MVAYDRTPTVLPPPVYFLSDAHLGAADIPDPVTQRQRLYQIMDRVAAEKGSLVLAGDLFDFWFEWKHVIPKQYFTLLHRIKGLTDQGVPVHLLAGNHDFRIHGFLEKEVGITTHQDAVALQIAGHSVFAFHGDGVLAADHGYRLLKRILRSRVCQWMFRWLHPDAGMLLARGTSQASRNATKGNPEEDAEYIAFAGEMHRQGFEGVVMGHAHRPMQRDDEMRTYVNLGDWIIHYTYAVHDGNRLMLKHYEQEFAQVLEPHPREETSR